MNGFDAHSRYLTAVRVAVVAGAFSVVVAALLLYDFVSRRAKHPAEDAAYQAVTVALHEQPNNEALKERFRELDFHLRQEYFRHRAFAVGGAVLLAAGLLVLLVAWKSAATLRRELPAPGLMPAPRDVESQHSKSARWAVAAVLVSLIAIGAAVVYGLRSHLPRSESDLAALLGTDKPGEAPPVAPDNNVAPPSPAALNPTPEADEPPPSEEEMKKAWPRFRGPNGMGVSAYDNLPTKWDGESGENIKWKTAVPLPGNSSPVVWGQRVFLTGATETQREVYCFDSETGALAWKQSVAPDNKQKPPEVMDATGFAAPTMATDGRRVYAMFATGDLAAITVDGKPAWSKSFGPLKNSYGHAASLCTYKDLLIVQIDQGARDDKKSKLYALKAATGAVAWEAPREVPNSWTTPVIARVGQRDLLITAADPWAMAYDPNDGKEIWRAKVLRQDVGPSPICLGGVVYTANEFPALTAIRADGEGDLTKDKETAKQYVLWKGEDDLPDTCSPLATETSVFVVSSGGMLTCYDAASGDIHWNLEFELGFTSSPSLVGKHLLLIDDEGKCFFVEPGEDEGKIVAEAALGEECVTSPAFQDGRMYIRGKEHLFCIGVK